MDSTSHRQQPSPRFQQRSSPIAIIHNPEDGAEQAKLRYQHPMYDTSDDEFDEDNDFFQYNSEGISVESATSQHSNDPHRSFRGGPQSLPTKLLRAPKLGSLSGQDYLLQHLSALPPPMNLDDEEDYSPATELSTSLVEGQKRPPLSQSTRQKPTYLSSYGSLRESHLTGRFGGAHAAASTGNLTDNRRVRFQSVVVEPPSTLGTSLQPSVSAKTQPPQKSEQSPQISTQQGATQEAQTHQKHLPALSIRDRMMQKAQQQNKGEAKRESEKPASTLSAMLEQQQPSSSQETASATPRAPQLESAKAASASPEGVAQAVAVSYNSNLELLRNAQQGQQKEEQPRYRADCNELSSSMTGLEILRAANRNAQSLIQRPTSLSILQNSSGSGLSVPPPPEKIPGLGRYKSGDHPFAPLLRTHSDPSPHWAASTDPNNADGNGNANALQIHASVSSPSLVCQPEKRALLSLNAGSLIPPRSALTSSTQPRQPFPQSVEMSIQHEQPIYAENAWTAPATISDEYASYQDGHGSRVILGAYHDDHNPDTEEAFDMDLE